MHAVWKGSISFGLVNIPVKMYTASNDREIKFTLLHKKDLSPIRYVRFCKTEDKEIPWSEIVKGYEYEKGEYVVITDDDFKKVNLHKSKSIEIVDFIHEEEIDPQYYVKPYFLEPEKNSSKAYTLLRDALNKSKKVGIAKFVIHNREHYAVLKPYENAILLNELRFQDELLNVKNLELDKKEKSAPKELEIAIKLIDHLTTKFNPKKYRDTYVEDIKEMIEKKAKGKRIRPKGEKPHVSKVHDIMSLLKESLEKQTKKPTRKRASA